MKLFLIKRIKQVSVSIWTNHFRPFRCWVPKHAFNLSFWPGLSSLFICITLGPSPSIIILKEESLILDTISVSSQKSFKSLRGESLLWKPYVLLFRSYDSRSWKVILILWLNPTLFPRTLWNLEDLMISDTILHLCQFLLFLKEAIVIFCAKPWLMELKFCLSLFCFLNIEAL